MASHPIFPYPSRIALARYNSEAWLILVNFGVLKNRSPASKINGSIPADRNSFIFTNRLDRPPSGFFFQPQGSNCPWTLPDRTMVMAPCPDALEHDQDIIRSMIPSIKYLVIVFIFILSTA